MDAQRFNDTWDIRIKFAEIIDLDDVPAKLDKSSREVVIEDCPQEWECGDKEGVVIGQWSNWHSARVYDKQGQTIAVVEHEDGPEILLAIGTGIVSSTVVGFVSWAWRRWSSRRKEVKGYEDGFASTGKTRPAVVVEHVEERAQDGRIKITRTVTIRDPKDFDIIARCMENAVSEVSTRKRNG